MLRHVLAVCFIFALMLLIGGSAIAADLNGGNLSVSATFPLGTSVAGNPVVKTVTPGASYSNVDNFLGTGFANQGSGTDPALPTNTITRLVADDLTPVGGGTCTLFRFSVVNFADHDISARPRVRFYLDNAGVPGNVITGFTFNPIVFATGSASVFTTGALAAASQFPLPSTKFWAGITFDNSSGATGAAPEDLDQLGQAIFNPPLVGSSANLYFETTSQGAFLSNNPPGATATFGGANPPPANFGWEFVVPEPGTLSLAGLGLLGLLARRR